MNELNPGKLKKSKSVELLWICQQISTANPAHLHYIWAEMAVLII